MALFALKAHEKTWRWRWGWGSCVRAVTVNVHYKDVMANAIVIDISWWLVYSSTFFVINKKWLCKFPFSTASGCVLLQERFVELRNTGCKNLALLNLSLLHRKRAACIICHQKALSAASESLCVTTYVDQSFQKVSLTSAVTGNNKPSSIEHYLRSQLSLVRCSKEQRSLRLCTFITFQIS